MKKINNTPQIRIKQSEHVFTIKLKTEGNGLGVLKTLLVLLLIAAQAAILVLSYFFLRDYSLVI